MDMPFNDPQTPIALSYGDVFRQTEQEYSRWNFDVADTDKLLAHFEDAEAACLDILSRPADDPKTGRRIIMAHPPMISASRPATSSTCSTRGA